MATERRATPRPPRLSRRDFLGLASAAIGLRVPRAWAAPEAGAALSPFEREHVPVLQVPAATRNGAKVPIVVTMAHPMSSDHYVTSIQVANNWDPVPLKGTFHLTPANGRVYLAFQARMHHGASQVSVVAECNQHGPSYARRPITIPEEAGG